MRLSYVGPYLSSSPGSAGLQRALGVSRSLVEAGAVVRIGTGDVAGEAAGSKLKLPSGISVEHVRRRPAGEDRVRKAISWFGFANDVIRWLETHEERPDAVILYGGGQQLAKKLTKWCRRHGAATLVDAVEWHDPGHQPLGPMGPFACDLERAMHDGYARADSVIVISDLLDRHFNGLGCRTLVVPPTTDVQAIQPSAERRANTPLRFVYAGNPGQKDLLRHIVEGMGLADPSGRRLYLDVAGPDAVTLSNLLGLEALPEWIHCHGRLEREEVLDLIRAAHYVPLLRPDVRYANAGFPTKVVESFCVGTPVIANLTSDLERHLCEGRTGFVAADASAHSFAEAVERALRTPDAEYEAMRRECRLHAEATFDFRGYTQRLALFVEDALGR